MLHGEQGWMSNGSTSTLDSMDNVNGVLSWWGYLGCICIALVECSIRHQGGEVQNLQREINGVALEVLWTDEEEEGGKDCRRHSCWRHSCWRRPSPGKSRGCYLAESDVAEKEKKQKPTSAPVKIKLTRPSPALVKTPPIEAEPFGVSVKGKSALRKKQKTQREYVVVSQVESKTKYD